MVEENNIPFRYKFKHTSVTEGFGFYISQLESLEYTIPFSPTPKELEAFINAPCETAFMTAVYDSENEAIILTFQKKVGTDLCTVDAEDAEDEDDEIDY